jgi:large subunit ribosomal protein L33
MGTLARHSPTDANAMAKGATKAGAILVKLVSTAQTGFFYVKRKNPKRLPRKLEFVKYDPRVRGCRGFVSRVDSPRARDASRSIRRVAGEGGGRLTMRCDRRFVDTCCSRRRRLISER